MQLLPRTICMRKSTRFFRKQLKRREAMAALAVHFIRPTHLCHACMRRNRGRNISKGSFSVRIILQIIDNNLLSGAARFLALATHN